MWHLNETHRQHREHLAALEKQKADGWAISDQRMDAARRQVELDQANAAAIDAAMTARMHANDAAAAHAKAQQDARGKAHEEQLLKAARLRWQGTEQAWEAAKGDVLADLLRREALGEPLPGVGAVTVRL